jgi:hypothetical protein
MLRPKFVSIASPQRIALPRRRVFRQQWRHCAASHDKLSAIATSLHCREAALRHKEMLGISAVAQIFCTQLTLNHGKAEGI